METSTIIELLMANKTHQAVDAVKDYLYKSSNAILDEHKKQMAQEYFGKL